ncbi:DUF1016 N-terminal domain-containing protein [Delftia acidovorans]
MTPLVPAAAKDGLPTTLHAELRTLVANSRQYLASAVNSELTLPYWSLGQCLATEVLGGKHAQYGSSMLEQLGQQLLQEFGRSFEAPNLRRILKFAQAFPCAEIVSTLSTKLNWTHLVAIVTLKAPEAQHLYARHAVQDDWSVRELALKIDRQACERSAIAHANAGALATNALVPAGWPDLAWCVVGRW